MNVLFTFIFLLCITTLGYHAGLNADQAENEEQLLTELSDHQPKAPVKSLTYAISVASEESSRTEGLKLTGTSSVEKALDHIQLTPHEQDLWHALGDDPVGLRVRRLLIADNHRSEVPGTDLFVRNIYEDLTADKNNSVDNLKSALNRVPASGFSMERISLLSMMSTVASSVGSSGSSASPGGPNAITKDAALNELTQNIIPARPDPNLAQNEEQLNAALSSTPDTSLPIASEQIFLNNTSNPAEALTGTVQGIISQPDVGIQLAIATEFVRAYPNMKDELNQDLQARGIKISLEGVQ